MKYFRTYPWALQLLLFLLMIFTMASLGQVCLGLLIPRIYHVSLSDVARVSSNSPRQLINASLIAQGILSFMLFAAPSLLFANLAHPSPTKYLGLKAPKRPLHLLLSILVILGAMPVLIAIEAGMSHIDMGADMRSKQAAAEAVQQAYLAMPDIGSFIRTFTVMAIIPALGEELLFRGMLMRFARQRTRTMIAPMLFTAVFFALAHSNYYGMPSIFMAGLLLATIYYLTGSLWCSIVAHLFFNGTQIIINYLNPGTAATDNSIHWGLTIGGAILFAASFFLLIKTKEPLPNNWYKDFDEEPLVFDQPEDNA